jgi:CelD/BcsL family acetyltransferase involved in cellulose biosynthesis
LLDRECSAEALGALLDWALQRGRAWGLVRFTVLAEDAPFLPMLRRELAQRATPFHARPDFERPTLIRQPSFDDYLASLPKDRRRRYRKGLRDLAAQGRVEVLLHRDLSAAPDLAERFMRLEAMGWKGAGGAALEARPGDAAFFRDVTRAFSQDRRLFVVELRLGGRPVAITVGLLAGQTLFCFKIAHDPAFAAVSPGALAEIETVRMLHETPGLTRADAGTEGETYLSGLWRSSVTMWKVDVPTPSNPSRAFVRVLPWLSRTWRAVSAVRDQARRSATKRR